MSVPMTSKATLVQLPPRSTSIGRVLPKARPIASIQAPIAEQEPQPLSETKSRPEPLKREKTKSRIWGLLGGKQKKAQVRPEIRVVRDPEAAPRSGVDDASKPNLRAAVQHEIKPCASTRSSFRPPALHISKPSQDVADPDQPLLTASSSMSFVEEVDKAFGDSPLKSPTFSGKGEVWESVVGSMADRPSVDGQRHTIEALMAPRGLPKRKSLTGLFGSAIKKAGQAHKLASPPESPTTRASANSKLAPFGNPIKLKSLAEDIEEASREEIKSSPVYRSRFGNFHGAQLDISDGDLSSAAAATSQLLNLVTTFDFSPSSHISGVNSRKPSLAAMSSFASLREGFNGSPTPIRKIKSAMLSEKISGSPLREHGNVSPLKLALHRSQVSNRPSPSPKVSTPNVSPGVATTTSLVKKGMRNIFAPPSPVPPPRPIPLAVPRSADRPESIGFATRLSMSSAVQVVDDKVGMGQTMGPEAIRARLSRFEDAEDVPQDLQALFIDIDVDFDVSILSAPPSPDFRRASALGLPALPAADRKVSRRPAQHKAPSVPLPPLPDVEGPSLCLPTPSPPSVEYGRRTLGSVQHSVWSDYLAPGDAENRMSFDFTSEYNKLDQGDTRASFVDAVRRVGSRDILAPSRENTPEAGLPSVDSPRADSPDHGSEDSASACLDGVTETQHGHGTEEAVSLYLNANLSIEQESDIFADAPDSESEEEEHQVLHATIRDRREPFRGQLAFQQHVYTLKTSPAPTPTVPDAHQAEMPYPASDKHQPRSHSHRRGESVLSIMTMSSIGEVIETGIAGDYTNYFDKEFANAIPVAPTGPLPPLPQVASNMAFSFTSTHAKKDSVGSVCSALNVPRPSGRQGHHRRNSSIQSIDSMGDIEAYTNTFNVGPPVSMHNARRSSYISKHRKSGSFDSSRGRSDWAAHRRNSSVDSVASNVSASRLVRPGLGERMFHLDGGVQLTAITGSPPDPSPSRLRPRPSHESILSRHAQSPESLMARSLHSPESLLAPEAEARGRDHRLSAKSTDESFFGCATKAQQGKRDFAMRFRPVSDVSLASSESEAQDDTFVHIPRYNQCVSVQQEDEDDCLEGDGEDTAILTPLRGTMTTGRQMLASSISRPAKPRGHARRRPAPLDMSAFDPPLATPGLTSPSASETSGRASLDTAISDGFSVFRARPRGAGHQRQKSSAGVVPQPTIREEPSMATLRAAKTSNGPSHQASRATLREPKIAKWSSGAESDLESEADIDVVSNWLKLQREADDECRRNQMEWADSEETRMVLADFAVPNTFEQIADFLHSSNQAYKPLPSLPSQTAVHRRKSSLSNSRALKSPYGLPLPKPVQIERKKGSLITKFERTNSATSSTFNFADDDPLSLAVASSRPWDLSGRGSGESQIKTMFARATPASPAPKVSLDPASPFNFQLPAFDAFGLKKQAEADKPSDGRPLQEERSRVTSSARRQALGWGRRRMSDGPDKVTDVPDMPAVPSKTVRIGSGVNVRALVAEKENQMQAVAGDTRTRTRKHSGAGARRARRVPSLAQSIRAGAMRV